MALLTVTESFAVFDSNGFPTVYATGRLVDDSDPVVKGRERNFETADAAAARVRVESASAAPGELRTRSVAQKRPAAARKKASGEKTPAKSSKAAQTPAKPAADPKADSGTAGGEKL